MDAKPLRGFRIYGDENAPPSLAGGKPTLHSRTKSSPALSALAAAGAIKMASRRAAFNDIATSTTGNFSRSSQVTSKPAQVGSIQEEAQQENRVQAPLLKPAQRPLSTGTSLKGPLGNVSGLVPLTKTAAEVVPPKVTANTRKVLSKKNTTIFRDYSTIDQPVPSVAGLPDPIVPISSDLVAKSSHVQQPVSDESRVVLPDLDSQPSRHNSDQLYVEPNDGYRHAETKVAQVEPETSAIEENANKCMAIVEVGVHDNQAILRDHISLSNINLDTGRHVATENSAIVPLANHVTTYPTDLVSSIKDLQSVLPAAGFVNTEVASKSTLPPLPEPEEYWDDYDDEDDENYDEDGYVTARSFRSRGDNLTGNATTTLMPKYNKQIRKELAAARDIVESSKSLEEIEDEAWDTTMVAEYGDEIFEYMRDLEIRMQPSAHYMDIQTEIQWSMRSVLMDWLVQVHNRFSLLPETLFLCVNYIDRFLSCKIVSLGKLQLVGATALFVAAKYEEINCPSVSEIVYMVDSGYQVDEILKAERFMLSMLQFELGWPGPMSFLRRISKADDYDLETRTLAKYFLELTIMDERFLACPPSFIAAGAHCLARMMLKKGNWSPAHLHYSGYTYAQLHSLVCLMLECCENPARHHAAIYDKYADKRYKTASLFVRNQIADNFKPMDVTADRMHNLISFYPDQQWSR